MHHLPEEAVMLVLALAEDLAWGQASDPCDHWRYLQAIAMSAYTGWCRSQMMTPTHNQLQAMCV